VVLGIGVYSIIILCCSNREGGGREGKKERVGNPVDLEEKEQNRMWGSMNSRAERGKRKGTLPPMMSQQSSLVLCLATSSRVYTLDDMVFVFLGSRVQCR
jgi:hypothetical protein